MSSNMERVAAMPDASLYVNRDGRRADVCVDSHGGGNLTKIPSPKIGGPSTQKYWLQKLIRRPNDASPLVSHPLVLSTHGAIVVNQSATEKSSSG